ncbi:MAG TPA: DUF1772 domain-containing protein [Chitinophagaceae bacterium]|nr:DUF1772 domain-containing protein [Chitinophagaceae bacterium]
MLIQKKLSNALALLATGLIAGIFFYATFFVLPTFWEVPTATHLGFRVALMRHNAVTMQLIMLTCIVATVWFGWAVRKQQIPRFFVAIAIAFTLATLFITRLGNVPINLEMKTWLPAAPPPDWLSVMRTWDFYHTCRTATAIGSFIMMLFASFSESLRLQKNIQ